MKIEVTGEDVSAPENNVEAGSDNLEFSDFQARLIESRSGTTTVPESEESEDDGLSYDNEATIEDSDEDEGMSENPIVGKPPKDVLSELNLNNLSAEQISALALQLQDHLSGKAPERIGELTRKWREEQERVAEKDRQIEELTKKKNPLERDKPIENNPFSDIDSIEELQNKYEEFGQTYEWAEQLLDEYDDSSYDDVITEVNGQELTKRQVRELQRNAYKAREKLLPARLAEIQKAETSKYQADALRKQMEQELPWVSDESSDLRKEYEQFMEHKLVKDLIKSNKELAPAIPRLLAHAMNSLSQTMGKSTASRPTAKQATPATIRKSPPSVLPNATAKAPVRDADRINKNIAELQERFQKSQSRSDFEALRIAQLAKR